MKLLQSVTASSVFRKRVAKMKGLGHFRLQCVARQQTQDRPALLAEGVDAGLLATMFTKRKEHWRW